MRCENCGHSAIEHAFQSHQCKRRIWDKKQELLLRCPCKEFNTIKRRKDEK